MQTVKVNFMTAGGVFLHTAPDGVVWELTSQRPQPKATAIDVRQLVSTWDVNHGTTVRLIGHQTNAELISALAGASDELGCSIEIASPRLQLAPELYGDPALVLRGLPTHNRGLPASLGGWHRLTPATAAIYTLIKKLKRSESDWLQALEAMPNWSSLRFLQCRHPHRLAEILGQIVDPRWFSSERSLDQSRPLQRYLGLTPEIISGARRRGSKVIRAQRVMAAWRDTPSSSFLWQYQSQFADPTMGELRTAQLFVEFVRLTWLHALYLERGRRGEPLFDPALFFPDASTAADYTAFMASA